VIGLGFMGRTHVAAYESARGAGYPCRLVAVCDHHAARRSGQIDVAGNIATRATGALFEPADVRGYAETEKLLADPDVRLVSICTPTDTHVQLAIAALQAGKHVLVEKPLALHSADAQRVVQAAAEASTLCMPAMCMRFWPGWPWLKDAIERGRFGPVRSAVFRRVGSPPTWSAFYANVQRSGGALVDLHVHDVDFIHWCFGDPLAVLSSGDVNHITTLYRYERGPLLSVEAEGGWIAGQQFRMHYRVGFEYATAEFEWGRQHPLLLTREGGQPEPIPLELLSAYDLEIRYMLDMIARGERDLRATVADAEAAARLLEAEHQSLLTDRPVRL
jgi:predicted dehydrogenase